MYRIDRDSMPTTSLRRKIAGAAFVAALAFSAGCGEDSAEPVEAPADEPGAQADTSTPLPTPDPCELPKELVNDQPWVRNIPC